MLALEVALDFSCCHCEREIGVVVKCEGEGLAEPGAKAMFQLLCPGCGGKNNVIFHPVGGSVYEVADEVEVVRYLIPVPSDN